MIDRPLVPRDLEGPLRVILVVRSSLRSTPRCRRELDRSRTKVAEFVRGAYDWPVTFCLLDDNGTHDFSARSIVGQTLKLVAAGGWDLIVAEDLTRITRYARDLHDFVQACLEAGVRVIGIDDRFDTAAFESAAP